MRRMLKLDSYSEDFMLCHMLTTSHMPETLMNIYKDQKIEIDLKNVNKKSEEIFNDHFIGADPAEALLIAVMLTSHLYGLFASQNIDNTNHPTPRVAIKKEIIQGYN